MQTTLKNTGSNDLSKPIHQYRRLLTKLRAKKHWPTLLLVMLLSLSAAAQAQTGNPVVDHLLEEYQSQGATNFSAANGGRLWEQSVEHSKAPTARSCTQCHGNDIRQSGKHIRTKRVITPLAPSTNPERLTREKKIRKWLKRNCKWTLGRECSAQEKGDLLLWIQTQ